MTKLRLTGGEPLMRENIAHLIRELRLIPGIEEIGLTTNGVLLQELITDLKDAGLKALNLSLRHSPAGEVFKNRRGGLLQAGHGRVQSCAGREF